MSSTRLLPRVILTNEYQNRVKLAYAFAKEQYGQWFKEVYIAFCMVNNRRKQDNIETPFLPSELVDLVFSFLQPYYSLGSIIIENHAHRQYAAQSSKFSHKPIEPKEKRAVMITDKGDKLMSDLCNTGRLNPLFVCAN